MDNAELETYARLSRSARTERAYATDWADFERWCQASALTPLPATPETVARYLADGARTLRVATLQRRLTAIRDKHRQAGYHLDTTHPQLQAVWRGIRRQHGRPQAGKAPLMLPELRAMVATLPDTLLGKRDRALLLIGFAGAFRRAELIGLDFGTLGEDPRAVGYVTDTPEGLIARLVRSKTDQEGRGRPVGIPYGANPLTCPVQALKAWQTAAGLTEGPVFRAVNRHGQVQPARLSDRAVAAVVQRTAAAAARARGLDEAAAKQWAAQFSGHSLRAGHVTSAAAAGVPEHIIMRQTGHTRLETLRGYIRLGTLWRENSAAQIGL